MSPKCSAGATVKVILSLHQPTRTRKAPPFPRAAIHFTRSSPAHQGSWTMVLTCAELILLSLLPDFGARCLGLAKPAKLFTRWLLKASHRCQPTLAPLHAHPRYPAGPDGTSCFSKTSNAGCSSCFRPCCCFSLGFLQLCGAAHV